MHGTRRVATRTTAVLTTAVVTTAVLLGAAGCGGGGGGDVPEPLGVDAEFVGVADGARPEQPMVDASVRLATALLDVAPAGQDVVVSPLSLQLALALLREGATGTVAEEIDAAAGLAGSQAVADLRALLATYEGDVAGIDPEEPPATPLLHIADSAFVQRDFAVVPEFLERVATYHDAQVYAVDFSGGDAKPALDAWVADETGGLLTECPTIPTPDTRLVLMDTVTFGATWASQFAPEDTSDGPFTRADGTTVQVPVMHATTAVPYAEGDGWVAVALPYTEGFAMHLVLPDAGSTLTSADWADAHAALTGASAADLVLTLPRWTSDSTLDLTDALGTLGLGSLTDPRGDLDAVFPDAYVSAVAQGATITVAEKGTVAAAVTAIGLAGAAMPPELVVQFDRPFEYQVVHADTGLVLFAGRVADPSADA